MALRHCTTCGHTFSVPDWLTTALKCPKCRQSIETGQPAERSQRKEKDEGPYTAHKGLGEAAGAMKDEYGNPDGGQYDLARDGAFRGLQIAVLQFYVGEGFDFRYPQAALADVSGRSKPARRAK